MLTQIISLGVRGSAVGGAAYFTVQKGVWSSSTYDGADALSNFRETVIPATNDYINQIPKSSEVRSALKSRWNSGIEWSAASIASFPGLVSNTANKCANYMHGVIFPSADK
ncbi:hypothetical protein EB796_014294 [Bugula neritina]|uniref:MICOS complex subunit MIC13 n=1 Tax=Bugula neritina TaxID=10212 RepID=A0A7J7JP43_BUGNE|nr:hypothetical protein EB796_014294 [Bugula neritina]